MVKKSIYTLVSLSLVTATAYAQKPNIVLFMVDDMGWQDTSVPFDTVMSAWNKTFHTPSMERLAAKGVKFTNAYATPVSTPSRVSLMTGMNVASHGVTNWVGDLNSSTDGRHKTLKMPDWAWNGLQPHGTNLQNSVEATTLPELLRENGYTTIHCGKAHFGTMGSPGEDPLKLGFDINIAGNGAGHPASYLAENNYGNATATTKKQRNAVVGLDKYWGNPDMFLSEALTLEALSALDSVRKAATAKPFYLYMAHYAVHTGYNIDKRYYQKYRDAGLDHIEAMYAGLLEGMDKSLGDIMDYLDKNNLTKNTIIIFMSDNGGLSAHTRTGTKDRHNWPARSGKGSALEGGIREPLIVYDPFVERRNAVVDTPVQITDFFPTLLDMALVKKYHTMQKLDGVSFLPLLKGKSINSKPFVWHYPNVWGANGEGIGVFSAIREGNYKLIYFYDTEQSELYDLSKDLSEMNNLAAKPQYEKIRKTLAEDLSRYLKEKKAKLPFEKSTGKLCNYPH
ncbi:MAG: sulfatase [Rikenellaceae bacterium]